MWRLQLAKKFADVVTDDSPLHASLERTMQALIYKDTLRAKTIECMNLSKSLVDEIVECKVLVASFTSARQSMAASAKAAKDAEAAEAAALARPQGEIDDEDGLDLQMESLSKNTESAPVDSRTPQQREAESKADIHLEAMFITNNAEKLKFELEKRPKNSPWLVLVDASNVPRRQQAIYLEMFKDLSAKGVTGRVMCAVGPSLYSAAQCQEQMGKLFSADRVSDTKLVYGNPSSTNAGPKRASPEYIISAELPNTRSNKPAPHVLKVQQYRGTASDVMCLRCDSTCEFASQRQQGDAGSPDDVLPEDCENANFEALLGMLQEEGGSVDPSNKRMWTFARPVEAYRAIWRQLGEITGAGTVVLVTGTASPNAILAAHAAFAELHLAAERRVFVLFQRVSDHAWHHGKATLLAGLRSHCAPSTCVLATSQGRCLLNDLQFIHVAQEPSGVDLADVPFVDSPLAGLDITVDIRTRPRSLLESRVPSSGQRGVCREEGSAGEQGWW